MPLLSSSGLGNLLSFGAVSSLDSDAAAYIAAVEAADGQSLEEATKTAINNFVVGCKTDGIWNAIKASCILMGARTLAGALVPLAGSAPTNNNFVSGDYNRKTGLKGNGSNKNLNSNRANNADPQNNKHIAFWRSESEGRASTEALCGSVINSTAGDTQFLANSTTRFPRLNYAAGGDSYTDATTFTGLWGGTRSNSTQITERYNGTNTTRSNNSATPLTGNIFIFSRSTANYTTARMCFYSIGESLDLDLLDARVSALVTAIGAAF